MLLRELASGCAALLMAFSPLIWQYSVTAEVFALNNFLLSLLCSLTVRFSFSRDLKTAMGGALVSGLALSNQHTAVLYVVPLAAWVMVQLVTSRCRRSSDNQQQKGQQQEHPWRRLFWETAALATFFLLGLTPYAFLPIAANQAPKPGSWGNVTTWSGLLHHLRRGDYGSLQLYSGKVKGTSNQDCLERIWRWFSDVSLVQGLGGVAPLLAVLGMLHTFFSTSPAGERGAHPGDRGTSGNTEHINSAPVGPSFEVQAAPSSGSRKKTASKKKVARHRPGNTTLAPTGEAAKSRSRRRGSGGAECGAAQSKTQQEEERTLNEPVTAGAVVEFLASWDDSGRSAPTALITALFVYLTVFHWLSNMPLDDPLLFGVHARFWMQPNIVVFVFCGVGLYWVFDLVRSVIGADLGGLLTTATLPKSRESVHQVAVEEQVELSY